MDEQKVASIIEMELMVLDILELAELKDFKDGDLVSRPQVVEKLWDYPFKENSLQNPKDMLKFTPDKTLEAIFEAKTNQECSMMWGHLVETFKLLMPVERFWEPGKLICSWNFGGTR